MMVYMELTKRLKKISDYVSKGSIIADVGTDHGYIPIYLALNGIINKAYAIDINIGPLKKAENNIHIFGVEEKVVTILSDGLENLNDSKVDTIIIAGMGGMLIKRILEEAKEVLSHIQKLIISPHLDVGQVRKTVHKLGFKIEQEDFIEDDGKYYSIIVCIRGIENYESSIEYKYGKRFNKESVTTYKTYLEKQLIINNKIIEHLKKNETLFSVKRIQQIQKENIEINEVIKWLLR